MSLLRVRDLLWLNGKDLRDLPLVRRKQLLRKIVPQRSRVLFLDHLSAKGVRLFEKACELDVEGIVAKPKNSFYDTHRRKPAWIKIKNRGYSQLEGREDFFQ